MNVILKCHMRLFMGHRSHTGIFNGHPPRMRNISLKVMVRPPPRYRPPSFLLQQEVHDLHQIILPWGNAEFQYIHEDDLVEIMYLLLKNKKTGVYNLAADGTMTFKEMLRILGGWPLKIPVWLLWPMNNLMWHLRITFMTEFPSSVLI